jgi:hypothetical protein
LFPYLSIADCDVSSPTAMKDDLPLKPDTPWGTEVRTLMREQDQGFDDAFAQVMENYFSRGRAEPLVDLLVRGRVAPGERARRFLAATIDPAYASSSGINIRYRLAFNENRGPGRPRREEGAASSPAGPPEDPEASAVMAAVPESSPTAPKPAAAATPEPAKDIEAAVAALSAEQKALLIVRTGTLRLTKGDNPGRPFWNCLIRALNAEVHWWPQSRFLLKAKLVRIGAGKGREKEPELEIRSWVLGSLVRQRVDRDGYEAAIALTYEELIKTGEAENWPGKIGRKTVKDAHARHARQQKRKK